VTMVFGEFFRFVFLSLKCCFINFSLSLSRQGEWEDKPLFFSFFLLVTGQTGSGFGSDLGFRWVEPLWFGAFCLVANGTVGLGATGIGDVEEMDGSDWGFCVCFRQG